MLRRSVFASLMVALGTLATPASASDGQGAYCAVAGGYNAYSNCGYYTFQQCLVAVSGVGGYCQINPRVSRVADPTEDEQPRRPQRRTRRN